MKQRIKKMIYWILGIFAIFVIFLVSGCSIYYPTSYRAFIPKQWDSEYKEYQRLCNEEIGKVVYARPVEEGVKLFRLDNEVKLNDSISVIIAGAEVEYKEYYYLYIAGFKYYTNWTQQSLSMHDNPRQYIKCEPFLFGKNSKKEYNMFSEEEREIIYKEESAIVEKIAYSNKEYIGQEYGEKLKHFSPYHYEYNEIYRQIVNFKTKESK